MINASLSYGSNPKVILIGTSESSTDSENLPRLPHVQNNLDELKRLFCDPDVIGLLNDAVTVLFDVEYSSAVMDTIRKAAQEAQGTLIIYYAGHGLYGDADQPLYLCARQTSDEGKAANGIPIKTVRKLIANSPGATRRILILDCCYAGAAFHEGMDGLEMKEEVKKIIDNEGTYGIAAVPGTYKALAPQGEKLTRFTRELVNTLEYEISEKGDMLTIDSIFQATRDGISRAGLEPPVRVTSGQVDGFLFARNRWRPGVDITKISESIKDINKVLEGFRATIAQYGTELAQIDRRISDFESTDPVAAKSSVNPPENFRNFSDEPSLIWNWCKLSYEDWINLPDWLQNRVIEYRRSQWYSNISVIFSFFLLICSSLFVYSSNDLEFPLHNLMYGPLGDVVLIIYIIFIFIILVSILVSAVLFNANKRTAEKKLS